MVAQEFDWFKSGRYYYIEENSLGLLEYTHTEYETFKGRHLKWYHFEVIQSWGDLTFSGVAVTKSCLNSIKKADEVEEIKAKFI